jgi:hypothetical protein
MNQGGDAPAERHSRQSRRQISNISCMARVPIGEKRTQSFQVTKRHGKENKTVKRGFTFATHGLEILADLAMY